MEDEVEVSGRTVEDATRAAETQLGASRVNLDIEVITAGRSGVFGIGAEQARIRVRRTRPAVEAIPEPSVTREESTVRVPSPTIERDEPDDFDLSADEDEQAPVTASMDAAALPLEAATVLRTLLTSMGFDAEVSVRSQEDPIMLAITGSNLGVLIGRRGDNLASLQFMVNLILSKNRRQWPRVVVDVENYRARREESLRSLADRIAYRVRRSGRPFTLEAMPAGDRRVIHLSLREETDVETYSIGEGVSRRVVIAPKKPVAVAREYH